MLPYTRGGGPRVKIQKYLAGGIDFRPRPVSDRSLSQNRPHVELFMSKPTHLCPAGDVESRFFRSWTGWISGRNLSLRRWRGEMAGEQNPPFPLVSIRGFRPHTHPCMDSALDL
jgi:hypothetical protein